MPTTEIITIINNSGKVISTVNSLARRHRPEHGTNNTQGKQLVSIFKEAQAAYRDKRNAVKAERAGIQRAKTFDVTPRGPANPYYNYDYGRYEDDLDHAYGRRRSHEDDARSRASSRYSRRARRSHQPRSSSRDRPALTESNLKTHSEVSATTPSKAYRSPYAETAPRDMQLSRPTLAVLPLPPEPADPPAPPAASGVLVAARERRQLVHRPRSDPSLVKKKSIDMNLAYGDVPPDLAFRHDLDPACDEQGADAAEDPQEAEALDLLDRIEDFLEEAQCMHHTASSMIESLQRNPEAAAAVALSLAELSSLIGKMSPGFLAFLKGGSPAVFALLASPQFLIAAGVAVGVTVVMFGGWKIVKRVKDSGARTLEAPLAMRAFPQPAPGASPEDHQNALPAPAPAPASAASYDEALVLEEVEELSSIETWRRGIVPFGEGESVADVELMSPEAERALREKYRDDEVDPSDSVSQAGRSAYSSRSRRSHRSHRSRRHHSYPEEDVEVPDRKSSRKDTKDRDGAKSEAASESHRSHRSTSSRSHHGGSTVSRASKHSSKTGLKAIEQGSKEDSGESVSGKPREKKRDMIKQLFKMKKDKEDRERSVAVSVLV